MSAIPDLESCLRLRDRDLLALVFEHSSRELKELSVSVPEPGMVYAELPFVPLEKAPWPDDRKGESLLSHVWQRIAVQVCLHWRYYEKHSNPMFQDTISNASAAP
jgi:hypothetical protein